MQKMNVGLNSSWFSLTILSKRDKVAFTTKQGLDLVSFKSLAFLLSNSFFLNLNRSLKFTACLNSNICFKFVLVCLNLSSLLNFAPFALRKFAYFALKSFAKIHAVKFFKA